MESIQKRNDAKDAEINLGFLKEINVRETESVIKYDCYVKYLAKHEKDDFCQFDFHMKDQPVRHQSHDHDSWLLYTTIFSL